MQVTTSMLGRKRAFSGRLWAAALLALVGLAPGQSYAAGPDTCVDADLAPQTVPFCIVDNALTATAGFDPDGAGTSTANDRDVHYRIDGLTVGKLYQFTFESDYDSDCYVGTTCGGTQVFAVQDRFGTQADPACGSIVNASWGYFVGTWTATTTTVYFTVDTYSAVTSTTWAYALQVQEVLVPPDTFAAADASADFTVDVSTELPFARTLSNSGLVNNYTTVGTDCATTPSGLDGVIRINGTSTDRMVTVRWDSPTGNEVINFYDATGTTIVNCSNHSTTVAETASFCVPAGSWVYAVLDYTASGTNTGTVTITDAGTCPADSCALADASAFWTVDADTELPFTAVTATDKLATTNYASSTTTGLTNGFSSAGRDAVLKLVGGATDKYVRIQWNFANTATENASLYVVTDCSNPTGTQVAGRDFSGASTTNEFVFLCARASTVYYVILDGRAATDFGTGTVTIDYMGPCAPTSCAGADASATFTVDVATELNATLFLAADDTSYTNSSDFLCSSYTGSSLQGDGRNAYARLTNSGSTDKYVALHWNQTALASSFYSDADLGLFQDTCGGSCFYAADSFATTATGAYLVCVSPGEVIYISHDAYGTTDPGGAAVLEIKNRGTCPQPAPETCSDGLLTTYTYNVDAIATPVVKLFDYSFNANDYNVSLTNLSTPGGRDGVIKVVGGTTDKLVRVAFDSASFDEAVYVVTDCGNILSSLVTVKNASTTAAEEAYFCAEAGIEYYVILDALNFGAGGAGTYTLEVKGPCMADTCAEADSSAYWTVDVNSELPFSAFFATDNLADDIDDCSATTVADENDGVLKLSNTTSAARLVRIWVSGATSNPDLVVLSGDCNPASCIYSIDSIASTESAAEYYKVPANGSLYVSMDSFNSTTSPDSQGTINVSYHGLAAPDNCGAADTDTNFTFDIAANSNFSVFLANARGHYGDYNAASCGSTSVGRGIDVVVKITNSGADQYVRFSMSGNSNDPDLILFPGTCSSACQAYTDTGTVAACIENGGVYFLALDTYTAGNFGRATVKVTGQGQCPDPVADTCAQADVSTYWTYDVNATASYVRDVSTAGMSKDYRPLECGSNFVGRGPDAVIRVVNNGTKPRVVTGGRSSVSGDLDLEFYGGTCPSLYCLEWTDSGSVTTCVEPGEAMYLIVDGYDANATVSGTITLSRGANCLARGNENCTEADAAPVDVATGLPYYRRISTTYMRSDLTATCVSSAGRDSFVKLTNGGSSTVNFTATWDFDGTNTASVYLLENACLGSNCISSATGTGSASVGTCLNPGQTVYFVADGTTSSSNGDGNLTVVLNPGACAGDQCSSAYTASFNVEYKDNTGGYYTSQGNATTYGAKAIGDGAGNDVWYSLGTVTTGTRITAKVEGDVDVYLLTGTCGSLTPVAGNDLNATFWNWGGATTVYAVVDSSTPSVGGDFNVTFTSSSFFTGDYIIGSTSCSSTNSAIPFHVFYGYTEGQWYISRANLTSFGFPAYDVTLTAIHFYLCSANSLGDDHDVAIALNQTATAPNYTDWLGEPKGTIVRGSFDDDFTGPGWVTITFDTPYVLNAGNGLIVSTCDTKPGYNASGRTWASNTGGGNNALFGYYDSAAFDCDPQTEELDIDDFGLNEYSSTWCTTAFSIVQPTPTPTPTLTPTSTPTPTATPSANASQNENVGSGDQNVTFFPTTLYQVKLKFKNLSEPVTVSCQMYNAVPPNADADYALGRWWNITVTPSTATFTASAEFTYDEALLPVTLPENQIYGLFRYNGADWELKPGAVDTTANTVTATGITAFSPWMIGSTLASSLPTLSEWGVILLLGTLSMFFLLRKQQED